MDCFTFSWLVRLNEKYFIKGGILVVLSVPPKIAVGHAHSKLILIGEHAVVYGKPAIAIPFPLEVTSIIENRVGGIMLACSHYFGPIDKVPSQLKGIEICIKKTLKYLKKPLKGLLIRINSEIPIGRGLGSSAAIAIAIVKSIFSFYERTISQNTLMELVKIAEVYAHGNPSGIDMAAASSEFPIWFPKEKEITFLEVGRPLHLVVADSGQSSDTFSAVKKVKEKFVFENRRVKKCMNQIEMIANMAKSALTNGDIQLLGRLLDENHKELKTMGVGDDRLDHLVETARYEGALGAKLTGGGRGGCIIALARTRRHAEQLSEKLRKAGANKTWNFTLEKNVEGLKNIYR